MGYKYSSWILCRVYLLLFLTAVTAAVPEYFVEDHCSQTLALNFGSIESVRLKVSRSVKYPDGMKCAMRVQAPEGKKLYVRFAEFNVRGIPDLMCQSGDYVQFYDGPNERSVPLPGLPQRVCSPPDNKKFVTSGRFLVLFFSSDTDGISGQGFHLSITAFTDGPCSVEQFQCRTSGRCIQRALHCDGEEGCIDGSDEALPRCLSTAAVIGIGVGGGVLLVAMIVVIVILIVRYKRRRRARIIKRALDARRYPVSMWISSAHDPVWNSNGSVNSELHRTEPNGTGTSTCNISNGNGNVRNSEPRPVWDAPVCDDHRLGARSVWNGNIPDPNWDGTIPEPVWDGNIPDPVWDDYNQEHNQHMDLNNAVGSTHGGAPDVHHGCGDATYNRGTRKVPSGFWDIQLSDLDIGPITEI